MNCQHLTTMYFSPAGGTKRITQRLTKPWQLSGATIDLLQTPLTEESTLAADELLIIGLPVYAGRIPAHCREQLQKLHGQQTPAIAAVIYGNRDYDDALLELTELLIAQGFTVIAAGAFIAPHSIFPKVGAGRPDAIDEQIITDFTAQARQRLHDLTSESRPAITVKGNNPYRDPAPIPLKPSANRHCTGCGACAKICPTGATSPQDLRKTDASKCIACTACIHICPAHARSFRGLPYQIAQRSFSKKCAAYQKPEVFFAE